MAGIIHSNFINLVVALVLCLSHGFVHAQPKESRVTETYKSSHSDYPEILVYTVDVGGDVVTLRLKRTSRLSLDVPVYVMKNGAIKLLNGENKQSYACYHDKENDASMVVSARMTGSDNWERTLTGTFIRDGHHLSLSQTADIAAQQSDIAQAPIGQYTVDVISSYVPDFQDDAFGQLSNAYGGRMHARFKRSNLRSQMYIELLIAVDYSIYQRFYNASSGSSTAARELDTINQLERYYAQVANGINIRYNKLEDSKLKIEVVLVGIYIAKTAEESYWTASANVQEVVNSEILVNATLSLEYLEQWSTDVNITSQLPSFDHVMLITGLNIWRNYDGKGNKNTGVAGSAITGGMCSTQSYSINEDPGAFKTIDTCAHELGHSMGSVHDGQNNNCDSADQYIMAATEAQTTDLTYKNRYLFSTCSVNKMEALITTLDNQNRNCLLNSATNLNNQTVFGVLTSVLPGQMYSVHEQCRDMYGSSSFYCGGLEQEAKLCKEMLCYNPETSACEQYSGMRAARGTTCGDRKWCMESDCVCGYDAPRATEPCTHGDYPGTVFANNTITCSDAASDPSLCYQPYFADKCCKSCADQYDACAFSDCSYGDLNPTCGQQTVQSICGNNANWGQCCGLCEGQIATDRGIDPNTIGQCRNQSQVVDNSTYECMNVTTTPEPTTTPAPSTTTGSLTTTTEPATTTQAATTTAGAPPTTTAAPTVPTTTEEATTTVAPTTAATKPPTTASIPTFAPYTGTAYKVGSVVRWTKLNNETATYTAALANSSSSQFKLTEYYACKALMDQLKAKSFTTVKTCAVRSFTSGSIVASGELGFSAAVDIGALSTTMLAGDFFTTENSAANAIVSDVNECSDSNDNDCSAQAVCTNTQGGFDCACQTGYDDVSSAGVVGRRCSQPCNSTSCSGIDAGTCRPRFDGPYTCTCNSGYNGTNCENNWNPSGEMEYWRVIIIAVAMGALAVYLAVALPYMIYQVHKYRNTTKNESLYRRSLERRSSVSEVSSRGSAGDPRIPSHYIPRMQRSGPPKPGPSRGYINKGMVRESRQTYMLPRPHVRSSEAGTLAGFSVNI